jgi:hypothetical protein
MTAYLPKSSLPKSSHVKPLHRSEPMSHTVYLAELRGLYGSRHGLDGKYRGLESR